MAPPQAAAPPALDVLIADRVAGLRLAQGLSLAALAQRSGVSKAMISRVERGDSSPTAAVLGRLAAGLGASLTELLSQPDEAAAGPLRRQADQETWRDPEVGYRRRQVAPRDPRSGVEMVEIEMPRGGRIAYPPWASKPYGQRLWMVEGALRVSYGDEVFELGAGDCLAFAVDRPLVFQAIGGRGCRYLLVVHDR
jgi:transcriptional regulator with XRE-family HTH domain